MIFTNLQILGSITVNEVTSDFNLHLNSNQDIILTPAVGKKVILDEFRKLQFSSLGGNSELYNDSGTLRLDSDFSMDSGKSIKWNGSVSSISSNSSSLSVVCDTLEISPSIEVKLNSNRINHDNIGSLSILPSNTYLIQSIGNIQLEATSGRVFVRKLS